MKHATLLAATALLTFTLTACGGANDESGEPAAAASSAPGASAAAPGEAAATPTPGATDAAATPGATPSASASATPTPSASATAAARPTAAAAPVAAATQPASFATCGVCHSVAPGQNMIGPSLAGVVGRRAGTASGFAYSPAMRGANITWNDGTLDRYLADPAAVVPGGSMPAPGVDATQRRAIIAYLKTL